VNGFPKTIRTVVITTAEIAARSTTEELVVQIRRKACQLAVAGTLRRCAVKTEGFDRLSWPDRFIP
jgi:hypothetical protein